MILSSIDGGEDFFGDGGLVEENVASEVNTSSCKGFLIGVGFVVQEEDCQEADYQEADCCSLVVVLVVVFLC